MGIYAAMEVPTTLGDVYTATGEETVNISFCNTSDNNLTLRYAKKVSSGSTTRYVLHDESINAHTTWGFTAVALSSGNIIQAEASGTGVDVIVEGKGQ